MRDTDSATGGPRPAGARARSARSADDEARSGDEAVRLPVVPRLVRSAFGLALGTVFGAGLFLVASFHAAFDTQGNDPLFVWLLGHSFLPGYAPTWRGAVAGLVWGLIHGFSLGWVVAWVRDAFLRLLVAWIARRERLRAHSRILEDLM